MGSITPFVEANKGRVRLEVDWTSHPTAVQAWLYRVRKDGTATLLRDGSPALLSHSKTIVYDVELPLDTPVRYRTTAPLNVNGSFETTVEEWVFAGANTATNGAVTRTTDYYLPGGGNAALRVVQNGSPAAATVRAASEYIPATVGTSYTASGYLMIPTAWAGGVAVELRWYNGTSLISTTPSTSNLWPAVGEWEFYTVTGTAPATTTQFRIAAILTGTPPTNIPMYVDELYATTPLSTAIDAAADSILPSNGAGWWKDALHPATMVQLVIDPDMKNCDAPPGVAFIGVGDRSRPPDASLLEVPDQAAGIGLFTTRKARRSSVRVASNTYADADAVAALHASGAPVLLQLPAQYGEPEEFGLYGDVASGRIATDQSVPFQIHAASFSVVRPPIGPADGVLGTRYADLTKFDTFAQASAASVTWFDALQGELA